MHDHELGACLEGLVALRAEWVVGTRTEMSRSLVGMLVGALRVELAYVRADPHEHVPAVRELRTTLADNADEIDAALRSALGADSRRWPRATSVQIRASTLSIAIVQLDFSGARGVLVAASERVGFPTRDEATVLELASQQLLLAWHESELQARMTQLSLTRAHLAETQQLSKTGSFIWDVEADDHHWSDEMLRIWEFEPAAKLSVARSLGAVVPDDLAITQAVFENARDNQPQLEAGFRIRTRSGAVKHLQLVGHTVKQLGDRPVVIGAIQDVTARRLAEEALDQVRSELDHASRIMSLGVLTASIAHEVNQPLSGILTNASTCVRMLGAEPPNLEGALETARRTIRDSHRATEIITRLRTLFGKKEPATELVDLNEAAHAVLALTRNEFQRHRIAIHAQLDLTLPPVIGDHVQLQQVIFNLMLNASDATKGVDDRPREVVLETARDTGAVRLSVRDTGIGIPAGTLGRLFDPFFTTRPDGMGIGLSVSRSIVERHGGKLWATTHDGPGATFVFSIPCAP